MRYASLIAFAALFAFAVIEWNMEPAVGIAYVAASAVCFLMYAMDKSAAREGRRRTPERSLLLMGLACGWPGAVLAQQWLRHKSAKTAFLVPFWATVAINAGGFAWLASTAGTAK